jgi:hypothetical protein
VIPPTIEPNIPVIMAIINCVCSIGSSIIHIWRCIGDYKTFIKIIQRLAKVYTNDFHRFIPSNILNSIQSSIISKLLLYRSSNGGIIQLFVNQSEGILNQYAVCITNYNKLLQ